MHARLALTAAVAAATLCVVTAGPAARVASRDLRWEPAHDGNLARELNGYARRGFRLAAISDGLPCEIAAFQAEEGEPRAFEYRLVPDRDIAATLAPLLADGWVPRGKTHGLLDTVVLERATPPPSAQTWRAVAFESYATLERELAPAAAEGFRVHSIVRQPFGGLFGRGKTPGMVTLVRAAGAAPRDAKVLSGTDRELDDLAGPVAEATRAGWQLDIVHTPRDTPDHRRVAFMVLSRARGHVASAGDAIRVTTPTIAFTGGRVLGIAPYQGGYVMAATTAVTPSEGFSSTERVQLTPADARCPRPVAFRDFHPPRRAEHDVIAVVARPSDRTSGGYDVLVVTHMVARRP